jgi:hypothetical protein
LPKFQLLSGKQTPTIEADSFELWGFPESKQEKVGVKFYNHEPIVGGRWGKTKGYTRVLIAWFSNVDWVRSV